MSRQNYLFKETVNKLLEDISQHADVGSVLPSDTDIASKFDISRSTARKAINHLEHLSLLKKEGRKKTVKKLPEKSHFFDLPPLTASKDEQIEDFFMQRILNGELVPGTRFSELELARESGCSTVSVREFLIRFSRFGLIEKSPRSQWQMKTFDETFVDQLYEVRHLFEMHSLTQFMLLPRDNEYWKELEQLLIEHKQLQLEIDQRFKDFSNLDKRFHRLLHKAQPNTFISQFYDVVSFVFHYHYQWDKNDEKARNRIALNDHIEVITNMLIGDIRLASISMEKHLITARNALKKTALGH